MGKLKKNLKVEIKQENSLLNHKILLKNIFKEWRLQKIESITGQAIFLANAVISKDNDFLEVVVEVLRDFRVNIDSIVTETGKTTLDYAIITGNNYAVQLLLKQGANVTHTDKLKISPIGYAIIFEQLEILKTLKNHYKSIGMSFPEETEKNYTDQHIKIIKGIVAQDKLLQHEDRTQYLFDKLVFSKIENTENILEEILKNLNQNSKKSKHKYDLISDNIQKYIQIFMLLNDSDSYKYEEFLKFYATLKSFNEIGEFKFYSMVGRNLLAINDNFGAIKYSMLSLKKINKFLKTNNQMIDDTRNQVEKTALKKLGDIALSYKTSTLYTLGLAHKTLRNLEESFEFYSESYQLEFDYQSLIHLYELCINIKKWDYAEKLANDVPDEQLKALLLKGLKSISEGTFEEIIEEEYQGSNEPVKNIYNTYVKSYYVQKALNSKDYKLAVELLEKQYHSVTQISEKLLFFNDIQAITIRSEDKDLYKKVLDIFQEIAEIAVCSNELKFGQCVAAVGLIDDDKLTEILPSIDTTELDEDKQNACSYMYARLALINNNKENRLAFLEKALELNKDNNLLILLKTLLINNDKINETVVDYAKVNEIITNDFLSDNKDNEFESPIEDEEEPNLTSNEIKDNSSSEIPYIVEITAEQAELMRNLYRLPVDKLEYLLNLNLIDKSTFDNICLHMAKITIPIYLQKSANKLASTLSTMVKISHELENDFTWNLGENIGVIRAKDPNVIKFDYRGETVHATISPKLIKRLEKSGTLEDWLKALHDGFAQTERGDNGIKIFGGIAELKLVSEGDRLYTDTKIINTKGHALILFKSSVNKDEVGRIAKRSKSLKEKYVETDVKQEAEITKSFDLMEFVNDLKELEKVTATEEDRKLFVKNLITQKYKDEAAFSALKLGQIENFHDALEAIGVTFSIDSSYPDFRDEITFCYNQYWINIAENSDE